MRCRKFRLIPLLALVAALGATPLEAADRDTAAADQIHAAAKQYTEALVRGDAQAMLKIWMPEGDIVDEYGNSSPARDVILREAAARAAASGTGNAAAPVEVSDTALRFLTPEVAIEDGRVEVSPEAAAGAARRGRFTAIWVKQDGVWRLASLREVRLSTPGGELDALDWMAGHWTGQVGKATFDITAHWNGKHTYLLRDLTITHEGQALLSGHQRIGIDPVDGKIKSWMHDDDGGHGEGTWTRHGDRWVVQATGVSPDGRHTTGTNIYTYDGGDSFTWKSIGATSNGQSVPEFEITLKRVAASDK